MTYSDSKNKKNVQYNVHTGSFGNLTGSQLENIQLPEKLRCSRCNKYKAASNPKNQNFSKKQLAEVRFAISKSAKGTIKVVCVLCTGGQAVEMHCSQCGEDKLKEYFSKNQRKNPDNAKCMLCMRDQLEFNPEEQKESLKVQEAADSGEEDDGDCSDDSDFSGSETQYEFTTDDGEDATSEMASLSITDSSTGYESSSTLTTSYFQSSASHQTSSLNTTGRGSAGGVSLNQAHNGLSSWQQVPTTRARKAPSSMAPSSLAMNGSTSSVGTPVLNSYRKFPKVPAYKPPQETRPEVIPEPAKSEIEDKAWESDAESEPRIESDDSDDSDDGE